MPYEKTITEQQAIEIATTSTKGAYRGLTYANTLKLNKCHAGHTLVAISDYVGRFGVNYYNIGAVIDRIGENAPKHAPSGLAEEIDDILYRNAQGEAIIRFSPNWSAKHSKVYILDGEEVSKEQLLEMGFSKSELHIREGGQLPEVINLKANQIISIR
jgi:hypothetical protein